MKLFELILFTLADRERCVSGARLNHDGPGAKLNNIMHIFACSRCVAKETLSPFFALFTEADFRAFEYYGDLEKYYRTG